MAPKNWVGRLETHQVGARLAPRFFARKCHEIGGGISLSTAVINVEKNRAT